MLLSLGKRLRLLRKRRWRLVVRVVGGRLRYLLLGCGEAHVRVDVERCWGQGQRGVGDGLWSFGTGDVLVLELLVWYLLRHLLREHQHLRRAPVARDHYLERVGPPLPLAPKDHPGRAGECRSLSTRQQSCMRAIEWVPRDVSDRINAAMHPCEVRARHPTIDRPVGQSRIH